MRQANFPARLVGAWSAAALLAGCGSGGGGEEPAPTPAATATPCDKLVGLAIPAAAIGLPTPGGTVTSATVVAAAGAGYAVDKADFAGGSIGGHEAPQVARRRPGDWDAIIAWYPAWKQMSAILAARAAPRSISSACRPAWVRRRSRSSCKPTAAAGSPCRTR
jgi:hypothetical protein